MRSLHRLSLKTIVQKLPAAFRRLPDERVPERVRYGLDDTLLSGLAMFFSNIAACCSFKNG